MSRTNIPVYTIGRVDYAPPEPTQGDPDNGMYFSENAGQTWVEIDNPGTNPIIVGAAIAGNSVDDIDIPDKQITVEAGTAGVHFGPFLKPYYSQDDLSVYLDIDNITWPEAGTNLLFRALSL